jgi:uncharacterized protein (TIGR02600 family)
MALILVISILGLLTLLTLAMFTLAESELKGARHYASGQQAKNLGDVAVNIAISQLRKSTTQDLAASGRETWISQPGMVRRYDGTGTLQQAYKLYSSSQMVVPGSPGAEASLLRDVPPANWSAQPERYVDLNKPISRAGANGQPQLRFPILDPRAMDGTANAVRGFNYSDTLADDSKLGGVVLTGGDVQRIPMPVEWLYVLKDGSLGVLNTADQFIGSATPSAANPIVGRIAFWTDDESSKLNINTASEPTPWLVPTFFHEKDSTWATKQPVNGEFQRYPGHPATTALSPVLFPGKVLSWKDKDLIYDLVPKIGPGGSHSGTVNYDDPDIEAVKLKQFRKEHLYASLDEFLLKDDRTLNNFGTSAITPETLQRTGFFLTAHSRAPESNPFGLPKIAAWPVNYRGAEYRSAFDNLISFCATLRRPGGKRLYQFQRGFADSPTADITQSDNDALLQWLLTQFNRPIPGFGKDGAQNFATKYRDDLPQILVEIFDYIRSTNLQDPYLVDEALKPGNTTANFMLGYAGSEPRPMNFKTFTDPRFVQNGVDGETGQVVENEFRAYPGHGQVTPSAWTLPGKSEPYLGIARFPTISEAGLHFICTADNTNDAKNPFISADSNIGKPGGGSAPKVASTDGNAKDRWYSNFPPNPAPDPSKGQKPNLAKYPKTEGYPYGKDAEHPGYKPENWNRQLLPNTPLKPGFRRVQARLLFEFFTPAVGYTITEPEFSVRVKGLSRFQVNGQQLFPNDEETVRTGRRLTHNGTTQTGGYGAGVKAFMREREVPARAPMPEDNQWGAEKWQVKPSSEDGPPLSVLNYDLVSNFIDIDVGANGGKLMQISDGQLQVEIFSGHIGKQTSLPEVAPVKVQTLIIPFPADDVKPPTLVRNAIGDVKNAKGAVTSPSVEPPYWWSFYGKGCMGFSVVNLKKGTAQVIGGRFWGSNTDPVVANEPRRGAFFYGFDPVVPGAPRPFRAQVTPGNPDKGEENEGSDVVQTVTVKHGDYRLTAAKRVVPASDWKPHRHWGTRRLAHNFSNQTSNQLPGYDYGGTEDYADRLVPNTSNASYANNRIPDFPFFAEASEAAHRHGDFDNAFGPERDGPYINKPDEGSLGARNKMAYYEAINNATKAGGSFFTPNRQIVSPVMFGSLPTRVHGGEAWRTLHFRPQKGHPGGPEKLGGVNPPDHLFLEFFWMPVVEPYAISEPFSTAGKVNLNYQILPFTNIRRSSGIRGVIENELITAVNDVHMSDYKAWPDSGDHDRFWTEGDGKRWHHKIDATKTLEQFEERFRSGKLFLSASEICDIHLVPDGVAGVDQIDEFWSTRKVTGDNTRERPYASIYPRVTTRSNTFRVHYVAQVITKARSSAADKMTDGDRVASEYRGSAVIQRYLDPQRQDLPDFAAGFTNDTLDAYHQFRIIETKRFGY